MLQVATNWWRADSRLKPVAMMAIGRANMPTPSSITIPPTTLPHGVTGTTSP